MRSTRRPPRSSSPEGIGRTGFASPAWCCGGRRRRSGGIVLHGGAVAGSGAQRALHGQRLTENDGRAPAPVALEKGGRVLAVSAGKPIWTQAGDGATETASALPAELGEREFLRDRLTAGRFWSLLPIVHFLHGTPRPASKRRPSFLPVSSSTIRTCGLVIRVRALPRAGEGRSGVRVRRRGRDDPARPGGTRAGGGEGVSGVAGVALARRARQRPRAPGAGARSRGGWCRDGDPLSRGSCGPVRGAGRDPRRAGDVPAARRLRLRDAVGPLPVRVPRARRVPAVPVDGFQSSPLAPRWVAARAAHGRRASRDPAPSADREP